ncbi:hypothetical protein GQ53DRAFT_196243 [Thozetella sp. PMI_491]|nr:hypothetical protein GQ53DRAFT_196243 [Thozetella sp. PMI_491]
MAVIAAGRDAQEDLGVALEEKHVGFCLALFSPFLISGQAGTLSRFGFLAVGGAPLGASCGEAGAQGRSDTAPLLGILSLFWSGKQTAARAEKIRIITKYEGLQNGVQCRQIKLVRPLLGGPDGYIVDNAAAECYGLPRKSAVTHGL